MSKLNWILCPLLVLGVAATAWAAPKPGKAAKPLGDVPQRTLKICVAGDAPAEVRQAAELILAAGAKSPLLQVMSEGRFPKSLTDTAQLAKAAPPERAYSHLILVGLPSDPMIALAWQREAQVQPGGFYIFGYGNLLGDIGYVESDRNPFLHGIAIPIAPFETEVVTVTGSTPAGVKLAAEALCRDGLVNGVVAGRGWKRGEPTLLDRDPLPPDVSVPANLPAKIGDAPRIGLTQASEDEYRGVLADTGVSPVEIWRAKYFLKSAWDGAGAAMSIDDYLAGLHRRAYGNTLWLARFASAQEAAAAAPKIAAAAKLLKKGKVWTGKQASTGFDSGGGDLRLWVDGDCVLMSTLPASAKEP